MKKFTFADLKKTDYRHYICFGISLLFLGCGFIFHNALPRLAESIRDLINAVIYYVAGLIYRDANPITATVMQMPSWEFAPERFEPLKLFPWTLEEFKVLWGEYWQLFITWDNVEDYFTALSDLLWYISLVLPVILLVFLLLYLTLQRYISTQNNDHGKESKPLQLWKRFSIRYVYPVKEWFKNFGAFLSENEKYTKLWGALWLLYFNVITIVIEVIAFLLCFCVSYNFLGIYTQLLKLMIYLAPMVRFIPGPVWLCIGIWVLNEVCRSQAYATLYHNENKNRGYVNDRGLVTIVYGNMGVGKTLQLTSLALTYESNLRDDALEIIQECALMFPSFPWDLFREEMKARIEAHELVDVPSIRNWVTSLRETFEWMEDHDCSTYYYKNIRSKCGLFDPTFGYDFVHYPTTYNNALTIERLFSVVEDYACAFFIYAIQTSLIISNYAIRSDGIKQDVGNFPVWDYDFFKRDPVLMDEYSRFSHILDFDMLRFGKRMIEENPNRFAFGFGVYVISEIDKERKNQLELKETKIKDDECNQRNDLFNSFIKMSRHAVVIRNRVFLKFFVDLQRPEDWGAGGRDVGELNFIEGKEELIPALPFFSPFWLCEGLFKLFKRKYDEITLSYDFNRADRTLFMHFLSSMVSKIDNHYRKVNNTFGVQKVNFELESGRMDGKVKKHDYYRMPKKDFSGRYSTNCLYALFIGDEPNLVSIADLAEYGGIMATPEELTLQNSHFQRDVCKMKKVS